MAESLKLTRLLEQAAILRQVDRAAAADLFEMCIQLAESGGDRRILASCLIDTVLELIEVEALASHKRIKMLMLRAEALLANSLDDCQPELAYLRYAQGIVHLKEHNFVDSLVYLQSAYRLYEGNTEKLSQTDDAFGNYYAALGDFQAALFHLERSHSRRRKAIAGQEVGHSLGSLGQLHLQMSQYDTAERYFQQSLEVALAHEQRYLQIQSLSGLGAVAIGREQWQTATGLLSKAIQLSHHPSDQNILAYLNLSLSEALLGEARFVEALELLEQHAIPYFRQRIDLPGLALTYRLLGKTLTFQLQHSSEDLTDEAIETVEDNFLEASMLFEQDGASHDYAKTLYDLACLYKFCSRSKRRYQYQGKAVRSLELALSILEKVNYGASNLIFQIEVLLNQIDRTVWLERAVNRLRGLKLLNETRAISCSREEVTLLSVNLCDDSLLMSSLAPEQIVQCFNFYLRCLSEVILKYRGKIGNYSGNGLIAVFTTNIASEESSAALAPTDRQQLPVTEQIELHAALRATLAAQEMKIVLQTINEELERRSVPCQNLCIGINTSTVILGNIDVRAKAGFTILGSAITLVSRLSDAAQPGQICISARTCEILQEILPRHAITVTEVPVLLNLSTYILNELSYYAQPVSQEMWRHNARLPAIVRLRLTVQDDLESVVAATVEAVVRRLGLPITQRLEIIETIAEIYKKICNCAPNQAEAVILFVPEETRLEIAIALEDLAQLDLQNLKATFIEESGSKTDSRSIVSTATSLTIKIAQVY